MIRELHDFDFDVWHRKRRIATVRHHTEQQGTACAFRTATVPGEQSSAEPSAVFDIGMKEEAPGTRE